MSSLVVRVDSDYPNAPFPVNVLRSTLRDGDLADAATFWKRTRRQLPQLPYGRSTFLNEISLLPGLSHGGRALFCEQPEPSAVPEDQSRMSLTTSSADSPLVLGIGSPPLSTDSPRLGYEPTPVSRPEGSQVAGLRGRRPPQGRLGAARAFASRAHARHLHPRGAIATARGGRAARPAPGRGTSRLRTHLDE